MNYNKGFSLIELMIVVAIVGILAAVAMPTYTQYLIQAGRAEGASMLMEVMAQQENTFRTKLRYFGNLNKVGYTTKKVNSETGLYKISGGLCSSESISRCVLLTATPQGAQASYGESPLTLDSLGNRGGEWP